MQVRRRWFAAGAAAAVVLAVGVVVSLPHTKPGHSAVLAQASPTTDATTPSEPTAEPTVERTSEPTPAAPSDAAATPPAAGGTDPRDTSAEPSASPSDGVAPSPSPSASSAPDPMVFLEASSTTLPTATKMTWRVRWHDLPGHKIFIRIDTDDGAPNRETGYECSGNRYPVTRSGEWAESTIPWSYRRAGTYHVTASRWIDPCENHGIRKLDDSVPVTLHVTQGASVANGPWEPHLELNTAPDSSPMERSFTVMSWDADGWGWKYEFDPGDGTEPQVDSLHLEDCRSPIFPETTWTTGGYGGAPFKHAYAEPGTYTVTLTFTSSNCDGGDVQSVTRTATVTVT